MPTEIKEYQEQLFVALVLEVIFYFWTYTRGLDSYFSAPIIILGYYIYKNPNSIYMTTVFNIICFLDISMYLFIMISLTDTRYFIQVMAIIVLTSIIAMKAIKIYVGVGIINILKSFK